MVRTYMGFLRVSGSLDNTAASLRIAGDTLLPERITGLLACTPTRAYYKGQTDLDIGGGLASPPTTGLWLLRSELPPDAPMEAKVRDLLQRTTPQINIWRQIAAYYRIELVGSVYIDMQPGSLGLPHDLLTEIARRHIDLTFSVFPTA